MYISPRHHPPREPQRLTLCLIDCSLSCPYSRCSAPHLAHPSFLSVSALSTCLPSSLAASYIPALHSLIECLTESVCLTEFMPRALLNGHKIRRPCTPVSVRPDSLHTYKKEAITNTRRLAYTTLPCECTAPSVAPTVPLPAVSLPSVSRLPRRAHTRRRPRR
jgi:hypothetical protein